MTIPTFLVLSIIFYAYNSIPHLILLLALVAVTWSCAHAYSRWHPGWARLALATGIGANLGALGIWKYGSSLIAIWNSLHILPVSDPGLVLPLGISFFSLQQIGYLLDLRLGRARAGSLLDHATFIMFFPQLLSGPIVTHRRMRQQFDRVRKGIPWTERVDMAVLGVAWLAIGLFKKSVIADNLALRVMPLVQRAAQDGITTLESWQIALSSGPIIYFDFSGYCDMAVGLGLLFGVRLPYNFDAPQRSSSDRSGWRRWHITFHNFVRDHVYRPLQARWKHHRWGGFMAILIVFAVSALWHGDGPRYILWGLLTFTAFIVLDRLTRLLPPGMRPVLNLGSRYLMFITLPLIFLTPGLGVAFGILERMVSVPDLVAEVGTISTITIVKLSVLVGLLVCLGSEISTQVLLDANRAHPERSFYGYRPPAWSPSAGWAVFIASLLAISMLFVGRGPAFFYNQF
ncbi:MAG: MBOAT family O-acyltransferase [Pseudomonadota bacterium]|nr:MBOAT family O-acyltransferase [Pseudomonadota bacterium]